jgi:hypothetical protein
MGAIYFSETSAINGLHGVISQKIVLFITAAVRTSNPISKGRLLYPSIKLVELDGLYYLFMH